MGCHGMNTRCPRHRTDAAALPATKNGSYLMVNDDFGHPRGSAIHIVQFLFVTAARDGASCLLRARIGWLGASGFSVWLAPSRW